MRKFNWKNKSLTLAVVILLLIATSPELRALLLLFDFLGAELLVLLMLGYARQWLPLVGCYLRPTLVLFAKVAQTTTGSARWLGYGLLPREGLWSQLDHLVIATGVLLRIAVARFGARDAA